MIVLLGGGKPDAQVNFSRDSRAFIVHGNCCPIKPNGGGRSKSCPIVAVGR
jgi:hypothetical protein